jgi:membrane protease YdiL (CAAX protease family)
VIAARPARAGTAGLLVAGVAAATVLRVASGGADPAASPGAAVLLTGALAALAVASGGAWPGLRLRDLAMGVAAGGALVGISLVGLPTVLLGARAPATTLLWWIPLVSAVAATEELVLRGVLYDALDERGGASLAVAVTAALFALIHLPLYGMQALPLDLCVGVFLGCLRVVSGRVTAPLVAHVVADVLTGWVG